MASPGDFSVVIYQPEAESYIESLKTFQIKDIGCMNWLTQHEYLEKLNMQAVMNARANQDEYVKEAMVTFDKVPCVIHELLATELWRQKIFPLILKSDFKPASTIPLYLVLYHEATIANLLETILYYKECSESSGDAALDLLDYCYRRLTELISAAEDDGYYNDITATNSLEENQSTNLDELRLQEKRISYDIGVKCVSILRYLVDCMKDLPLSLMSRVLNTHNIPVLLVRLVANPPWTRRHDDGTITKYVDGKWTTVPADEQLMLTKLEGQVWITVFTLLMNQECQQKYDMNTYNKNQIIKLRAYLNEVLIDQIPTLVDLQRFLEHLAMMDPPPPRNNLVLEQIPEMREELVRENEGKWGALTKHQIKKYFNPTPTELRQYASRFSAMYNLDTLEELISDPPKCALCGQRASKRCSRCQNEWYCRRECQVEHWKKHKAACNLLAESINS